MDASMVARVETPTARTEYSNGMLEMPETVRSLDSRTLSSEHLLAVLDTIKERNKKLPDETRVRSFIGSLTSREIEDLARSLDARLRGETAVLDALTEEGLDPFVPELRDIELPYPVRHVSADELRAMNPLHKGVGAFYRGGTIFVGPNLPDLRERLINVATRGILSNDLFHEVYHGHQDGDVHYASIEDVLHSLINPHAVEWKLALAESHAWLCCLRGFKDEVLMPVIQTSYDIANGAFLERAFRAINGLNALGLSDKQVGTLIGQTHWDGESEHYAVLDPELARLAEENGLTEGSLQGEIEKRKLVERIQALRAMGIAAEFCSN